MPVEILIRAPAALERMNVLKLRNDLCLLIFAEYTGVSHNSRRLLGCGSSNHTLAPNMSRNVNLHVVTAGGSVPMHISVCAPSGVVLMLVTDNGDRLCLFLSAENTFVEHLTLGVFSGTCDNGTAIPCVSSYIGFHVVTAGGSVPVQVSVRRPAIRERMDVLNLRNCFCLFVFADNTLIELFSRVILCGRCNYGTGIPDVNCYVHLEIVSAACSVPMDVIIRRPLFVVGVFMSQYGNFLCLFRTADDTLVKHLALGTLCRLDGYASGIPAMYGDIGFNIVTAFCCMPMYILIKAPIVPEHMSVGKRGNLLLLLVATDHAFVDFLSLALFCGKESHLSVVPIVCGNVGFSIVSTACTVPVSICIERPIRSKLMLARLSVDEGFRSFLSATARIVILCTVLAICIAFQISEACILAIVCVHVNFSTSDYGDCKHDQYNQEQGAFDRFQLHFSSYYFIYNLIK